MSRNAAAHKHGCPGREGEIVLLAHPLDDTPAAAAASASTAQAAPVMAPHSNGLNGTAHPRVLKPGIYAPIPTFFVPETEDLGA